MCLDVPIDDNQREEKNAENDRALEENFLCSTALDLNGTSTTGRRKSCSTVLNENCGDEEGRDHGFCNSEDHRAQVYWRKGRGANGLYARL